MIPFIAYLKDYFQRLSLKAFLATLSLAAILVIINYTWGIEKRIRDIKPWYASFISFFLFYGFVYFIAWAIQSFWPGKFQDKQDLRLREVPRRRKTFLVLLLVAPLYFSAKMVHWDLSSLLPGQLSGPWDHYALIVMQLPAKLLLLLFMLFLAHRWEIKQSNEHLPSLQSLSADPGIAVGPLSFWGLTTRNFKAGPYLLLLVFLLPLIIFASTQPDFLRMYPKVGITAFLRGHTHFLWFWQLIYECSYGLDFVSIELFFRGFLVIGLARYAGAGVVLPMAAFYCTIHFGKPLGECISSFFGGLALGVIAWRSGSIIGGLIVHLGLAWLMELGGAIGRYFAHPVHF